MARNLTPQERDVLARVVPDPDAWWAHAQNHFLPAQAEAALKAKLDRWRGQVDLSGPTRAVRDAAGAAAEAARRGPSARLTVEDLLEEVLDPANATLAAVRAKLAARLQARGG